MQTLKSLSFLVKAAMKIRNLQISKILNIDTNRIFPVPFPVPFRVPFSSTSRLCANL